jgi:hypothetical protein
MKKVQSVKKYQQQYTGTKAGFFGKTAGFYTPNFSIVFSALPGRSVV